MTPASVPSQVGIRLCVPSPILFQSQLLSYLLLNATKRFGVFSGSVGGSGGGSGGGSSAGGSSGSSSSGTSDTRLDLRRPECQLTEINPASNRPRVEDAREALARLFNNPQGFMRTTFLNVRLSQEHTAGGPYLFEGIMDTITEPRNVDTLTVRRVADSTTPTSPCGVRFQAYLIRQQQLDPIYGGCMRSSQQGRSTPQCATTVQKTHGANSLHPCVNTLSALQGLPNQTLLILMMHRTLYTWTYQGMP
jgi:hypothetical protein